MGVTCAVDTWKLNKQDGVIVICKVSIDEATESLEKYQDRIGRQRKYLVMQESRPLARTMRWRS